MGGWGHLSSRRARSRDQNRNGRSNNVKGPAIINVCAVLLVGGFVEVVTARGDVP